MRRTSSACLDYRRRYRHTHMHWRAARTSRSARLLRRGVEKRGGNFGLPIFKKGGGGDTFKKPQPGGENFKKPRAGGGMVWGGKQKNRGKRGGRGGKKF